MYTLYICIHLKYYTLSKPSLFLTPDTLTTAGTKIYCEADTTAACGKLSHPLHAEYKLRGRSNTTLPRQAALSQSLGVCPPSRVLERDGKQRSVEDGACSVGAF